MTSTMNADAAPLQPDIQLTTLLTLPSLLTHFTLLPPNLQSHVLLTLMRQAPLPVLRNIHSVLSPAMSRDFLTQLPAELVSIILSFLPGRTLARCTRVSKAWKSIIDSDPILWRELLRSSGSWFGGGPERAFARTLVNRRSVKSGARLHYARGHRRQLLSSPSLSSSSSSTIPTTPAIMPSPSLELPHPYKILFKSRQLTRTQWARNQHPKHVSFAAHGSSVVTCLLFSHNRIISASDDHSIHVYNPLTGQLVKSLEGHGGGVWALAATKDTLVSGSTDRTVRIWDLEKGKCTHVFGGHKSTVRCLAIVKPELLDMTDVNANNEADEEINVVRRERWPKRTLIVTGSRDHTLRVWKLPKAHEPSFFFTQEEEGPDQVEVCDTLSPLHRLTGSKVADHNPYHVRLLSGHGSAVRALAARGRTLVSGSYDHTVRVWDIITGVCKWVLSGHTQKGKLCCRRRVDAHLVSSVQHRFGPHPKSSLLWIYGQLCSHLESLYRAMRPCPHRPHVPRGTTWVIPFLPCLSCCRFDASSVGSVHRRSLAHFGCSHRCNYLLPTRRVQDSQWIRRDSQDVGHSRRNQCA